jgi:hypothetical protein
MTRAPARNLADRQLPFGHRISVRIVTDTLGPRLAQRSSRARRASGEPPIPAGQESKMSKEQGEATVGKLFDLLLAPTSHNESELADLLGIGVEPLRDRMKDLRRRGLVAGPFRESSGVKWKLGFSTGVAVRAAARASRLDLDASVTIGDSSWIELGRESKRVAAVVSNHVKRWISPPSA